MSEIEAELADIGDQAVAKWVRDTAVTASLFHITGGDPDGVVVDIRPALDHCGINTDAIPEGQFQMIYHFVDYGDGYWVEEETGNGGEFVAMLHGLAAAFLSSFGDMMDLG